MFSAAVPSFASVRRWVDAPKVADLLLPEIALQRPERGGLSASGRFPSLAHIGYMKIDEVAKGPEAGGGRVCGRQPLIDPGFRLGRAHGRASSRRRNVSLA